MLSDMMYINGIIATELVNITEHLAAMRKGEDFLTNSKCIAEHRQLSENVLSLVKKYKGKDQIFNALNEHVLGHIQDNPKE